MMKAFRSICISTASCALYVSGYALNIPGLRNVAELLLWVTVASVFLVFLASFLVVPSLNFQQLSIMVAELKPRGSKVADRVGYLGVAVSAISIAFVGHVGVALVLIGCRAIMTLAVNVVVQMHKTYDQD